MMASGWVRSSGSQRPMACKVKLGTQIAANKAVGDMAASDEHGELARLSQSSASFRFVIDLVVMAAAKHCRKNPRKENDSNADRSEPSLRPDSQKFLHGRSQQYFCAALCNESSRLWWSIHPAKMPACENRA